MTTFFAPANRGTGTGATLADARSWEFLDDVIEAGTDKDLRLLTDQVYDNVTSVVHAHNIDANPAGAPGARTVVRGVGADGVTDALVHIRGSRVSPFPSDNLTATNESGEQVFDFFANCSHIEFRNFLFENVETCFNFTRAIDNVRIANCHGRNVRRFIENTGTGADVTNSVFENLSVRGFSKSAVRLRYNSHNIILRRGFFDSERQDRDDFAIGVFFDGTTHHVLVEDVVACNSQDTRTATEYWNADGFVNEELTDYITYRRCVAFGCTDTGFDLKADSTVLEDCSAFDNKRNFRLWGKHGVLRRCTGHRPNYNPGSPSSPLSSASPGLRARRVPALRRRVPQ